MQMDEWYTVECYSYIYSGYADHVIYWIARVFYIVNFT